MQNKNWIKFEWIKFQTWRLKTGPLSYFEIMEQSSRGSLYSASSVEQQTIDRLCLSSNKAQTEDIRFLVFSSGNGERLIYQANKDSWAAVFGEEMPCQREIGNGVIFFSNILMTYEVQRDVKHKSVVNSHILHGKTKKKKWENLFQSECSSFAKFSTCQNLPILGHCTSDSECNLCNLCNLCLLWLLIWIERSEAC